MMVTMTITIIISNSGDNINSDIDDGVILIGSNDLKLVIEMLVMTMLIMIIHNGDDDIKSGCAWY